MMKSLILFFASSTGGLENSYSVTECKALRGDKKKAEATDIMGECDNNHN